LTPSEYLLIGRIQKRNTRPLTVSEVMHRERTVTIEKLESEVFKLQGIKEFD
jgi:hypothetical protein